MRSPVKSGSRNGRDAEAELNLPPGFRFHPTDEELVVHYLCRKAAVHLHHNVAGGRAAPPPIIAEVDLYKHDPWDLPELALFGTKEWYFFTPRDRKYPNGSRPNRAAGSGYWKATGADKPVRPKATPGETVGIKKALVFYVGKAPNGIKTIWIMHEYRLALPKTKHNVNGAPPTIRLDDWVLCRLYNKKNNMYEKIVVEDQDRHHLSPLENRRDSSDHSQNSFNSFEESDAEITYTPPKGQVYGDYNGHDVNDELEFLLRNFEAVGPGSGIVDDLDTMRRNCGSDLIDVKVEDEDENGNDWFTSLSLEDLQYSLDEMPFPSGDQVCGINYQMPIMF